MAKYEIMLIIDGTLKEDEAKKVLADNKKLLSKTENLQESTMGLRDLAYPIKKINKGFYYVLTFSTDKPEIIAEFRRVINLNKFIIRFLIINLEKDYAYKSTINPKKVKRSQFRLERYNRIKESIQEEQDKIKIAKDNKPVKLTDI